jgi:hypothetical protein
MICSFIMLNSRRKSIRLKSLQIDKLIAKKIFILKLIRSINFFKINKAPI